MPQNPNAHLTQEARMDHMTHRPGTIAECPDCRRAAYEPAWYAALIAFDLVIATAGTMAA